MDGPTNMNAIDEGQKDLCLQGTTYSPADAAQRISLYRPILCSHGQLVRWHMICSSS